MRTRAVLGGVFASIAILVIGWQAGSAALTTTGSATSSSQQFATSGTAPTATTSGSSTATSDGTYTGASVNTRFGSVQVSVTLSRGAITDVTALKLTDDGRKSVQISNRAAPVLRDEVIASQSANVANVGGATYTTDAYLASLQSALDQARF